MDAPSIDMHSSVEQQPAAATASDNYRTFFSADNIGWDKSGWSVHGIFNRFITNGNQPLRLEFNPTPAAYATSEGWATVDQQNGPYSFDTIVEFDSTLLCCLLCLLVSSVG